jgi:hypothetical protein
VDCIAADYNCPSLYRNNIPSDDLRVDEGARQRSESRQFAAPTLSRVFGEIIQACQSTVRSKRWQFGPKLIPLHLFGEGAAGAFLEA